MAKDKSEPIFEEPEFDELDFLKTEKERAKSVVFMFVLGLLLATLSAILEINGMWYFSILLFFIIIYLLKPFFQMFRIRMPKKGSHKFFLFAEFFFNWLVFWVILLNPPFATIAGPQFSTPQAQVNSNFASLSGPGGNEFYVNTSNTHLRVGISYIDPMSGYSITETIGSGGPTTLHGTYSGGYFYFNITAIKSGVTATFDLSLQSNGRTYSDVFQLHNNQ